LLSPKRSTCGLGVWELKLSITRWIVCAFGYRPTTDCRNCANSGEERFGFGACEK
jgi:hypothetical protein